MRRLGEQKFDDILNHYWVVDKSFNKRVINVYMAFVRQKIRHIYNHVDLEIDLCSEKYKR